MFNKSVQDAINEQIRNEFYSAHLYLSMSAWFHTMNLSGSAHWMSIQAQEEIEHAMRFFKWVNDRGGRVVLQAIPKPPSDFSSTLDVFQQYLAHEKEVTEMISKLYAVAAKEGDLATQIELQWFITEQVEEEKLGTDIVEQVKMIGENKTTLLILDRQLGARAKA